MVIYLKKLEEDEFTAYFNIRCDENNVKYTGHVIPPEYEKLKNWFLAISETDKKSIYLAEYNNTYVGYLHLDFEGEISELGYGVLKNFCNKGIGTAIVKEAIKLIVKDYKNIREIIAWIADFNQGSKKCVLNNKFKNSYETKTFFYEGFKREFTMFKYVYETPNEKELISV